MRCARAVVWSLPGARPTFLNNVTVSGGIAPLDVSHDFIALEPGMEQTQTRNMRCIVYGILKEPL